MMENSEKSYALVTGATSGIGYELVKLLAKDGYNLIITARHEEGLKKVSEEIKSTFNVDVVTISKDLFERKASFELYDEIRTKGLKVSVLINDAGQGQYGEFVDTDINRELDIIQLNISSLVVLTKLFLQDMVILGEGKILNVASVASKIPGPLQSVYHGTKAFVHSFTEAVRNEVKDTGVIVTSLLPGATDTDFFNKADMLDAKNIKDAKLADASKVAKDGYEALMDDDDMVISGLKNKIQVALGNLLPDAMVAKNVHEHQAPVNDNKK